MMNEQYGEHPCRDNWSSVSAPSDKHGERLAEIRALRRPSSAALHRTNAEFAAPGTGRYVLEASAAIRDLLIFLEAAEADAREAKAARQWFDENFRTQDDDEPEPWTLVEMMQHIFAWGDRGWEVAGRADELIRQQREALKVTASGRA